MDVFRVGYAARDIVFDAFRKYCRALPADVSEVVIQRERVLREAGVSEEDLAKQEASFCAAIFPNTAPTLYWSVVELFSRPEILHEVRREIEGNAVQRQTDASGNNDFVLDVASLKTRCPLLLSVFQETQRTRAINAMIRRVMDDTLLDGQYLLKKGNYLQIPSQPMHQSKSFWGTSAEEFDPYRFMANAADNAAVGNGDKSGSGGSVSSMFMPWGAAPHLCPARQFASTEIMLVMALLAMRVELRPTDKNGQWDRKTPLVTGDITTVLNPVKDLRVRVGARPEGIGKWTLEMGESRTKVPLASG